MIINEFRLHRGPAYNIGANFRNKKLFRVRYCVYFFGWYSNHATCVTIVTFTFIMAVKTMSHIEENLFSLFELSSEEWTVQGIFVSRGNTYLHSHLHTSFDVADLAP